MKRSLLALSLALVLGWPTGLYSKEKQEEAPKSAVATAYDTKTAKVLEIDAAKRLLTLEGEGGSHWVVQAGPEVKNFANIQKGDLVKIQTTESWMLSVSKKEKGEKPSAEAISAASTAPSGQKPEMEAAESRQITAEVVKVDAAKQTVELKGPAGKVLALKTKDPKHLEGLKKGDMIAATYTEAMAISVEAMPK